MSGKQDGVGYRKFFGEWVASGLLFCCHNWSLASARASAAGIVVEDWANRAASGTRSAQAGTRTAHSNF